MRFVSRMEKVRVPMVVEIEVPSYKRPTTYNPSPLGMGIGPGAAGLAKNAPISSLPYGSYTPYNRLPAPPGTAASASNGRLIAAAPPTTTTLPPAPLYSSPYYYPSPTKFTPTPIPTTSTTTPSCSSIPATGSRPSPSPSSRPNSPITPTNGGTKLITQSKNYIVLETPDATPGEDYRYLFGDHVEWNKLKVLPKNHPSCASRLKLLFAYAPNSYREC